MEEILASTDYWEKPGIDIRINPALELNTNGIEALLLDREISSAVVLATSGSEGTPKYIILEKRALLVSAAAVNHHCQITENDTWLGGLSTFHVGGLSIYARAYLNGAKVKPMEWHRWTRDGQAFLRAVEGTTITSLTPVHLHDLIENEMPSPKGLRGVFIGGGHLDPTLAEKAVALGWSLWPTFGMTETASQIATSLEGTAQKLPILPHWKIKTTPEGRLAVKGDALMAGFITRKKSGEWQWNSATDDDGFYETGDLISIASENRLQPLGRADHQLKILGELVSLVELETSLTTLTGTPSIVIAKPDPRRGQLLHAFLESDSPTETALEKWNEKQPPFKRIETFHSLNALPRTTVGKVDRQKLADLI